MLKKLELNRAGIGALLKDPGLASVVIRAAGKIANAAGDGFKYEPSLGSNRARATVWADSPQARRRQAKEHTLEKSIDAGRS